MSTPFTIPTPPIDLRRDIQAFPIHHEQSTRKPIQDTIGIFLDALQHHEPVDRSCDEYEDIKKIFVKRLQLVTEIHDGPGARYHFVFMREEFEKVRERLYRDTGRVARSAREDGGVGDEEGDDGDRGGEDILTDKESRKLDKGKEKVEDGQGDEETKEQDVESETAPVAGNEKGGKLGRKATTKSKSKKPKKGPSPSNSGDESDSSLKKELDKSGFGTEGLHDYRKKRSKKR